MDIKVPHLGDGIASANVLAVLVKQGDTIELDQTLLELETDKAVAPVPATASGQVETVLINEGDSVKEGMIVVKVKGSNGTQPKEGAEAPTQMPIQKDVEPASTPSILTQTVPTIQQPIISNQDAHDIYPDDYLYSSPSEAPVPASHYVRKIAYDLDINLKRIRGTGNGGRVTISDLKNYIQFLRGSIAQLSQHHTHQQPMESVKTVKPAIDFSKWGAVTVEKASGLRVKIAEKMVETWNSVPQVTQYGQSDITDLMALRKKYKSKFEKDGLKLTLTVFALKAAVEALQAHPIFNASFSESTNEIIHKHYYHIGVAVDTESGLVVPVIRDVDKKSTRELAAELDEMAQKARDRKLDVESMRGGTFTISNLGGLGAGAFSPIVNDPEVAIMGVSKGAYQPIYDGKEFKARLMMPLSVSYDHRVIDGAEGARFIHTLQNAFETFKESLLKGK